MADEAKNGFKKRPVRILREDVARRIAAGEVIDRPAAIVRELMDNAVDSGATAISVEIKGGGIDFVKVSDNGTGMTKDDLENCANPHATSKIVEADDLSKITTLGFRGEALASIAAVGVLTISSGNLKMSISNSNPRKIESGALFQDGKGTSVCGADLFADFPARRRFLKRPASETMMCRETFIEKALARPDIAFKLKVDGSLRYDFPANVSLSKRFTAALEIKENISLIHEIKSHGKEANGESEWKFSLVIGDPAIRRNDRRNLFIYVNGRKVQEYSLLQAIEYGCQGFFPNGTHPVAALFAEVDPSLVDFNIHPAKKEVKFKDISSLHHGISSSIRSFFRTLTTYNNQKIEEQNEESNPEKVESEINKNAIKGILVQTLDFDEPEKDKQNVTASVEIEKSNFETNEFENKKVVKEEVIKSTETIENLSSNKTSSDLRSRFFNFDKSKDILSSKDFGTDKTISADNFSTNDVIISDSSHSTVSTNDVPASTSDEEKKNKETSAHNIQNIRYIGRTMETFIILEKKNILYMVDQHAAHERIIFDRMLSNDDISAKGRQNLLIPYRIETEDDDEEKYIESLLKKLDESGFTGTKVNEGVFEFSTIPAKWNGTQKDFSDALLDEMVAPERIMYKIFATAACRRAIMQGTPLDDKTAEDIAKQALELPDPHCPHGRPIWFTLTKEQMFARVRRTEN